LYLRLVGASLRAQLAHRADFWLGVLGTWLTSASESVGLWALFHRFESVQGWTLPEVGLLYGVINVAFAISDSVSEGFDQCAATVRSAEFDRLLLRPRSLALLLFGQELALRRVGRLIQGIAALLWASSALRLSWRTSEIVVLCLALAGGVCLFCAIFVLQAAASFWTRESLEVFNAFNYGGKDAGQYPITLYAGWFRKFFTFVVPLSLVSYFPVVFILGRADPLGSSRAMQAAAPLAGALFLALSLSIFRLGVRRYTSAGS
jgi:ABC-2 type transport system permease protein